MNRQKLAALPSVNRLIEHFSSRYPHQILVAFAREEVASFRKEIRRKAIPHGAADAFGQITKRLDDRLSAFFCNSIRRVVNATGVLIHTGLGRSPLSVSSRKRILEIAENYTNLEFDLETGGRGSRTDHVEELICVLTGTEAATVVNNNAAAVLITVNTLSAGKETIVSRGELVEIGGSFRMPDVMEKSNAKMVEVGTTNKTHASDYARSIRKNTGLILKVHTSNYKVVGFVNSVDGKTLVELGRKNRVPVAFDLGSGALVSLEPFGLPEEPLVRDAVSTGYDLVMFSGDKLLGGPQCGIIVGRRKYIELIRKNPLMRAVRCDKMTYAALEATLRLFLEPEKLKRTHPVTRMLTEDITSVTRRARSIQKRLRDLPLKVEVVPSFSEVGSGALPLAQIESRSVVLKSSRPSVSVVARRLRERRTPVIGYLKESRLWLDCRTVRNSETGMIVQALTEAVASPKTNIPTER